MVPKPPECLYWSITPCIAFIPLTLYPRARHGAPVLQPCTDDLHLVAVRWRGGKPGGGAHEHVEYDPHICITTCLSTVWTLDKKMDLGLLLLRGHKKYIAQGLTVFGPD